MKQVLIFLFTLGVLLTASCDYSNIEQYVVDPIAGDSTLINVNTNLDTVAQAILTDSLLVSWEATVEKGELYYVEALLSDLLMYELSTDYDPDTIVGPFVIRDSFWLDVFVPLAPGIHPLELYFYYSSNSNSLADYYRVEAATLKKEFQVNLGGVEQ